MISKRKLIVKITLNQNVFTQSEFQLFKTVMYITFYYYFENNPFFNHCVLLVTS